MKKGLKTAGPDEVEMVKMGEKRGRGVQQLKNASLLIENYKEGKIGWEGGEEREERKYKLGVQKLKDVAREERRRREGGEKEASMCPAPDKAPIEGYKLHKREGENLHTSRETHTEKHRNIQP